MKIHIFRLKRDREMYAYTQMQTDLDEKYPIYAFTQEKELAMQFLAERKKNNFIYVKVEKDDEFAEEWCMHHRLHQLGKFNLETFINKNLNTQDVRYVEVLATEAEINYVLESIDTMSITHRFCNYISPDIFTEEVYEALKTLGYVDMARYHISMEVTELPSGIVVEPKDDEDFGFIGTLPIQLDQFGSFILIYDDMLTKRFYEALVYREEPTERYITEPKKKHRK